MEVREIPGLEHLPYAEVWFHAIDDNTWRTASQLARALGKPGLEAWTTDATPEVAAFLVGRGYDEVRRYVVSELDLTTATAFAPARSGVELTALAGRPELAGQLHEIACEAYPDQPGRAETRLGSLPAWRAWALDPHPPEACFVAVDGHRALAYGTLSAAGAKGAHEFTGVRRAQRGRGLATVIKHAQIAWAKQRGLQTLRTANELRLPQMLALNTRCGYRPLYEEVVLRGPASEVPPT